VSVFGPTSFSRWGGQQALPRSRVLARPGPSRETLRTVSTLAALTRADRDHYPGVGAGSVELDPTRQVAVRDDGSAAGPH